MASGFILILGMVAAGKSLQSRLLAERHGWSWLSTGELLRSSTDTVIQEALQSGLLLDDHIIFTLLETNLAILPANRPVIMDGFPRRVSQAEWLKTYGQSQRKPILRALHLNVSSQTAMQRLAQRARSDDTEAGIAQRNLEYDEEILPVVAHYRQAGLLDEIDADQSLQAVAKDIDDTLAQAGIK